jgi:hypothetical protein
MASGVVDQIRITDTNASGSDIPYSSTDDKKQKGHGDRPWPFGILLKLKLFSADSPGHGTKSTTPYAGGRLDGLGLG